MTPQTLADTIYESSGFIYLSQSMKDKHAFNIMLALWAWQETMKGTDTFAGFNLWALEQMKEADK